MLYVVNRLAFLFNRPCWRVALDVVRSLLGDERALQVYGINVTGRPTIDEIAKQVMGLGWR